MAVGGQQPAAAAQSFIPPKFPVAGAHEDGSLIKPSEYLKSIGSGGAPTAAATALSGDTDRSPLHRTKSELSVAVHNQQQHQKQPLAAISIQDLHSVQLKKTPGTVKITRAGSTTMNCNSADKQSGKAMITHRGVIIFTQRLPNSSLYTRTL